MYRKLICRGRRPTARSPPSIAHAQGAPDGPGPSSKLRRSRSQQPLPSYFIPHSHLVTQSSVRAAEHSSAGKLLQAAMALHLTPVLAGAARQHGGEVSCHKLHFQWRRHALARQLGLCTCCGYYACRIRLSRTASGGLRSSSACCPLAEPWLPQVEHIMFCSRQAVVLACRAPVLFWKRSCVGLHRILPRGTSQHRFLMMIMGQSGHLKSAQGLCASCGVPGRRFQPSRVHHRPP